MPFSRTRPLVLLVAGLVVVACRTHDPATELELLDVETYWIVDSPRAGENFIAPWGSIQEQVSTWKQPLQPGQDVVVVVRSVGRYHASADPEDMLRSPGFRDPRARVFVRIGSSNWAMLAEAPVERRIGAPEVEELLAP